MALESNNTDTDVEAVRKAAKWTRFTAVATACSAGTSLAWALSVIAKGVLDHMDHLRASSRLVLPWTLLRALHYTAPQNGII